MENSNETECKICEGHMIVRIMAPKILLKMVHREDKEKLTRNCKCHVDPYLPDKLSGKGKVLSMLKGFCIIMLVFKLKSNVFDL